MRRVICAVLTVVLCGSITSETRQGRRRALIIPLGQERYGKSRHESLPPTNQTFLVDNNSKTINATDPQLGKSSKKDAYYSSSSQQSTAPDGTLQDQPNQQSNYDTASEYEKEFRRRQDLRRRHEEERQRRLEERRRLEDERRRLEDERRRQRQNEDRRRQINEQGRIHEQQPQVTEGYQDSRQHLTSSQNATSTHHRAEPQDPTSQDALSRTGISYQQGQRHGSTRQQSGGDSSSTDYSYYRPSIDQQPRVYEHGSHNISHQQKGLTHEPIAPHIIPNQRPVSRQHPIQTDHRLPLTPQRGVYPGLRTRYEYGSQGQIPRYPHQEVGGSVDSYYPYDEQSTYSNCPDTGIDLRINGVTCQQAVQQFGNALCYTHEYTSKQCCQVCRPMKQPSKIGCEYGDHAPQCSSIKPADCYDLRNRQICCETCQKLRRNDTPLGCEYGDMTTRCETCRQNPGLCYRPDNQRICCETCSQTRNVSNPGCPWGDFDPNLCQMFDDHTNKVRINCYSHQRRRLCCQTCERLKEWIPANLSTDCQYGDRPVTFASSHFGRLNCSNILSHFSTDECRTNPTVFMNCCYTCHRYRHSLG